MEVGGKFPTFSPVVIFQSFAWTRVTKTLSAAELTRQQELGSAWIFRRALKDNIRYTKWQDILNDPKYEELGGKNGIYPTVDKDWLETFFLQQQKMLQEFSDSSFTEFNREYGFMKFISEVVKNKFGISNKIVYLYSFARIMSTQKQNNVKLINSDSKTASTMFEDKSLDIIYIDASHDYVSVLEDIKLWHKKLKQNGFICGDDYIHGWDEVIKAVDEYFGKNEEPKFPF